MSESRLIAVIDDDEPMRSALTGLVRALGYEARGFASGEEFLEGDAVCQSSCIITDIQMAGMSGIELKRELNARQCRRPVIMITGRPEPTLEREALAAGAICLLRKPFEASMLIECLQRALAMAL